MSFKIELVALQPTGIFLLKELGGNKVKYVILMFVMFGHVKTMSKHAYESDY